MLVEKPNPTDYKCRTSHVKGEIEWTHDDESEAIKYFVAEEYYQRMRAEFAIAALYKAKAYLKEKSVPHVSRLAGIDEALKELKDNE